MREVQDGSYASDGRQSVRHADGTVGVIQRGITLQHWRTVRFDSQTGSNPVEDSVGWMGEENA